jgi:DMSO/TMAO reductase YedYZ molybdopterin-dependent catalytic subunit
LVVPGWFGTNSTKWLCRLEVSSQRAKGEFVDRFYTEEVPKEEDREGWNKWDGNVLWTVDGKSGGKKKMRPVWKIQVNSMIVKPQPDEVVKLTKGDEVDVEVEGWTWSDAGVQRVEVSIDGGKTWVSAAVEARTGYGWQKFKTKLRLGRGDWVIMARAECKTGMKQPLQGRRNHVHSIKVSVE